MCYNSSYTNRRGVTTTTKTTTRNKTIATTTTTTRNTVESFTEKREILSSESLNGKVRNGVRNGTYGSRVVLLVLYYVLCSQSLIAMAVAPPGVGLYFLEQPADVIVPRGTSSVTLNCSATSVHGPPGITGLNPPVRINWTWNGAEVEDDKRRYVQENGALYIKRVSPSRGVESYEGRYECVASIEGVGAVVSRTASVKVAELNQFNVHPADTEVVLGETAWLHCSIKGQPSPHITWEKDKQPLQLSDRLRTLQAGTVLEIKSLSVGDVGRYRCRAENLATERYSEEAKISVRVSAGDVSGSGLLVVPQDVTALIDSVVRLDCVMIGQSLPNSALIQWSRSDGKDLVSDDRYGMVDRTGLVIESAGDEDEETYECRLQGSNLHSASASLIVTEPPRFESADKGLDEVLSQSPARTTKLRCDIVGTPDPDIRWLKNGLPVRNNGRVKINEDGRELVISSTTGTDSGLYQCRGENGVGEEVGRVIRLHLELSGSIPLPPTWLEAEPLSSRSISLNWDHSADPNQPSIIVGYAIHYQEEGHDEIQKVEQVPPLILRDLKPYTNYTFYIISYSAVGPSDPSQSVYATTLDEVPISAPRVHFTVLNSSSVDVTWEILPTGDARGQVTRYRVLYRALGPPSGTEQVKEVPGTVRQLTLTGLTPLERYEIQVLAGTNAGFPIPKPGGGPQWPRVTVSLTDVSPPAGVGAVRNFNARLLNGSTCLLTWEEPVLHGTTSLKSFVVRYKQKSPQQGPLKTESLSPDTINYTVYSLEPDSEYEFSIHAMNKDGDDGQATVQTVRTPSAGGQGIPLPATSLTATPLNSSSVQLSWEDSSPNRNEWRLIDRYTVLYRATLADLLSDAGYSGSSSRKREAIKGLWTGNVTVYRSLLTDSSSWRVIIGELQAYTRYTFVVQPHAVRAEGPYSREIECRTLEGVPEAPQSITGFLAEPRDIQLSWSPPHKSNGPLTFYLLSYTTDPSSDTWIYRRVNVTSTFHVLSGLDSGTTYYLRVQAETRAGRGPPSNTFKISTVNDSFISDKSLGILTGICIAVGCLIICIFIILLRNRCRSAGRGQGHPGSHASLTTVSKGCNGRHVIGPHQTLLDHSTQLPSESHTVNRDGGVVTMPMLNHRHHHHHHHCSHQSDLDTKGSDQQVDHINNFVCCNGYINRNGIIPTHHPPHQQLRQQKSAEQQQTNQRQQQPAEQQLLTNQGQPAEQQLYEADEEDHWQSRMDDSCTPMVVLSSSNSPVSSLRKSSRSLEEEGCVEMASTVV